MSNQMSDLSVGDKVVDPSGIRGTIRSIRPLIADSSSRSGMRLGPRFQSLKQLSESVIVINTSDEDDEIETDSELVGATPGSNKTRKTKTSSTPGSEKRRTLETKKNFAKILENEESKETTTIADEGEAADADMEDAEQQQQPVNKEDENDSVEDVVPVQKSSRRGRR